jgi:signal peptidase I
MLIRVRGRSMVPALRPGHLLWASKTRAESLERGQIVLIRLFRPPPGLFLKRIVGLPGEHVKIKGSHVIVNGQPLTEPYVNPLASVQPTPSGEWTLEADDYIVLGDARDDSLDSRRFGPVHSQEIDAIVRFRLWPPGRI